MQLQQPAVTPSQTVLGQQQYHQQSMAGAQQQQQQQQQPSPVPAAGQATQQQQQMQSPNGAGGLGNQPMMQEPEMCTTCPNCQTTIYLVRGNDAPPAMVPDPNMTNGQQLPSAAN